MYKNDLITSYVYEVNIIKIKCVVYVMHKSDRKPIFRMHIFFLSSIQKINLQFDNIRKTIFKIFRYYNLIFLKSEYRKPLTSIANAFILFLLQKSTFIGQNDRYTCRKEI